MTNSGDAAEQVVRLSLEGFEVAAKLTGSAAKNIAILLASVLKQEATQANKTRGKARLTNMIKSGKELKVFSIPNKDLKKDVYKRQVLYRYNTVHVPSDIPPPASARQKRNVGVYQTRRKAFGVHSTGSPLSLIHI